MSEATPEKVSFFKKIKNAFLKRPLAAGGAVLIIAGIIGAAVLLSGKNVVNLRQYNNEAVVDFSVSTLYAASVSTDSDGKSKVGAPRALYVNFDRDVSFDSEKEKAALAQIKISPAVAGEWFLHVIAGDGTDQGDSYMTFDVKGYPQVNLTMPNIQGNAFDDITTDGILVVENRIIQRLL